MTSRANLIIAGPDIATMVALLMELGSSGLAPTLVHTPQPVLDLTRRPCAPADLAIVCLQGDEGPVAVQRMIDANPGVEFVLLAEAPVETAPEARVLPADEPPVLIAAMVTALLTPPRVLPAPGLP